MKSKLYISFFLFCIILTACKPNQRVALADKLMSGKDMDSAITVLQSIENPLQQLSDRDYALYALLMSEAVHRKGELNAATDTLLLPAINYFSQSGDSLLAARALYCKGHLERQQYRMNDALQSFLKALYFLQTSNNYEQLYRVNTWLEVTCIQQGEYSGAVKYSKAALDAAEKFGNNFYKNMALCDIATGYFFLNKPDSALHFAREAYNAALTDSLPQQLTHIYTNLGTTYNQKKEYGKALNYINKAIELRPVKDTFAILELYSTKVDLFGSLGQYDSAFYYYQKAIESPILETRADAVNFMAKAHALAGHQTEAYTLLSQFVELADSVYKKRQTEESIALQELYQHEQLSIKNLYWRNQAIEKQNNLYYMIIVSLLLLWGASAIYIIYRRRLIAQQKQLIEQQKKSTSHQKESFENQKRIIELKQKEAKLKKTFFRGLSQHLVNGIENGDNIILTDNDWDDIMRNADSIFDGFTLHLQQKYPTLNKEDLRYCCMVKMQLSQMEMAQIMHLEKDSVKKRLKRIRMEKMGANSGTTLEELFHEL